jgi:hypothetical protein
MTKIASSESLYIFSPILDFFSISGQKITNFSSQYISNCQLIPIDASSGLLNVVSGINNRKLSSSFLNAELRLII